MIAELREMPALYETCAAEGWPFDGAPHEPVVGAAVLVSAAFRMRDERGLIAALRQLASAVEQMERHADLD